jgi:hypothetical protein
VATTIRDYLSKLRRDSQSYTPAPEPVPIPKRENTVGSKRKQFDVLKWLTAEKEHWVQESPTNFEKRQESPFNQNEEH